jgi:hypothetical protein
MSPSLDPILSLLKSSHQLNIIGLLHGFLSSDFRMEIVYEFFISPMHAVCCANFILLD